VDIKDSGRKADGMKGNERSAKRVLLMIVLMVLCGCASWKGQHAMSGDYKKMIDLQQRKASAIKAQEPSLPAGYEATAEIHEQLGDACIRQGDSAAALTEYRKSLEKEPLRTTVQYKIGMLFLGRKLPEEAIKEFDQIIAREPGNASSYHGRARARFLQGNMELSKSDLRAVLSLNDKIWQAHTLLGVIYDTEKRHSEAEDEYLKALAIQPDSAAVYNNLGVSLYLNGKFDKAADSFLKAFNINPDNRRICNNLGLALYRLGNTADALEAFRRGGSEATAHNNIGYLQMKDKQYNNALAALEKAIEENPSYYLRAQKNIDKVKAELKNAKNQQTPGIMEQ
jgi:Flp pilus assembly protein TadD